MKVDLLTKFEVSHFDRFKPPDFRRFFIRGCRLHRSELVGMIIFTQSQAYLDTHALVGIQG
jgi:hypothetical protein